VQSVSASVIAGAAEGGSGAVASGQVVTVASVPVSGSTEGHGSSIGVTSEVAASFISGAVSAASQAAGFIAEVIAQALAGSVVAYGSIPDPNRTLTLTADDRSLALDGEIRELVLDIEDREIDTSEEPWAS